MVYVSALLMRFACSYEVKPFGLVYKIVKKNATLDERYVELSLNNIPDITLPDADKYDERTWVHCLRSHLANYGRNGLCVMVYLPRVFTLVSDQW